MKKITIILFVLLLMCATGISSFAQTSQATDVKKAEVKPQIQTIRGKIIFVDLVKNTIVLKEGKAGTERILAVNSKVIASLKVNEEVKVSVNEGSNVAVSVKEIVKKTASTKK